jgi:transketolase
MSESLVSNEMGEIQRTVRKNVLKALYSARAGHLGSSMSIIDILISIYLTVDVEKIINHSPDRDRVIMSKGHAAAGTYGVMNYFGIISDDDFSTYHMVGSYLQGHVSHGVTGVEHSTGALGHGLSVGVGHAIALRNSGSKSRVFVVCGDGEIQEGSIWEALMLASTMKLSNLIVLIDYNKISSITSTEKIIHTGRIIDRFSGFGVQTIQTDGHDVKGIMNAISQSGKNEMPTVIVCDTVKGKGVAFAENMPIWHYKNLSAEEYEIAVKGLA